MRRHLAFTLGFSGLMLLMACGYTIRSSENSPLAQLGIRKIFVEPLANNTYRAGIDAVTTNALLRTLSREGGLRIVSSRNEADAVLSGSVTQAAILKGTVVAAQQLRSKEQVAAGYSPGGAISETVRVATTYSAQLGVTMILERTRELSPKTPKQVWANSFTKAKVFSGSTQLGSLGNTSALINDSEFDQSLTDLADIISVDVYQSMTSLF